MVISVSVDETISLFTDAELDNDLDARRPRLFLLRAPLVYLRGLPCNDVALNV